MTPLLGFPIWAMFIIIAVILLSAHELGVRLRRTRRSEDSDTGDQTIGGNYLGASLALLALLVGFSFSMGVDRYNKRVVLVVEEANAITTVQRRFQSFAEPVQSTLVSRLLTYVEAREAFSSALTPGELAIAEQRTDALELPLWSLIIQSVGTSEPAARVALDATNTMFDLAESRRAGLEAQIPRVVLFALLLYSAIAAIFMGYSHPVVRRYVMASSVQFVLLSLAIALVIDLDRPRTGFVEVSQAPLYRAAAAVRAAQGVTSPVLAAAPKKPDGAAPKD